MSFTLTEDQINAMHKQEFDEAAAEYGGTHHDVPWDVRTAICDRTRNRWIKWVAERDAAGSSVGTGSKHDKTRKIEDFLASKIGKNVTPEIIMEACECSRGTVYKYITDNRGRFAKVVSGVYRVVDANAERAAAGRPTAPSGSSGPVKPMSNARRNSDIVNSALDRLTGGGRGSE